MPSRNGPVHVATTTRKYKDKVYTSRSHKERTKRTHDALPVHSFQTLLQDLKTLAKNRVCIPDQPDIGFYKLTQPTPLQERAFALLGVAINM